MFQGRKTPLGEYPISLFPRVSIIARYAEVSRKWATTVFFGFAVSLSVFTITGCRIPGVIEQEVVRCSPDTFLGEVESRMGEDGRLAAGSVFLMQAGHYRLQPEPYREDRCGNCEDPSTPVDATVGLRLSGRGIVLEADDPGGVVIHTDAGYGLLFEDCTDCVLRGVTITGGIRDADPNATDAAVVVKTGSVRIEDCVIEGNLGDSTLIATNVVGIMGIAGREGSSLTIRGNRILRNSWDGIALYRGARAVIEENLIDGVDKAGGRTRGGGRGVAIGVTWDAVADIRRNRVTRYWKGIGLFVDARGIVKENVVEEMLTWGIAYWDAGRGKPAGEIEHNVVYDTGACGISISREEGGAPAPGFCRENVIARTGRNPRYDAPDYYCYQCPLAVHARPGDFEIRDNWLLDNRRAPGDGPAPEEGEGGGGIRPCPGGDDGGDLTGETFRERAGHILERLEQYESLRDSRCFDELPR